MSSLFTPAAEPPTELARVRPFARGASIRCSPFQLGALSVGQAWSQLLGSMDKEQSFKLLDAYVEAGGNTIDTANAYQSEESEIWLGEWMKERKNRDQLVIATKYSSAYKNYELGPVKSVRYVGNNRKSLHMSVRDSLAKLQTDYIDILYVHWWDWITSIEEVMDSLHVLVEQGKVLYLGISDTPAWVVSACNEYARAHAKTPFIVYQGWWNVMIRDFERDIIPMARHYGMALAPWDVVGGGKFQSKKALEERKARGESLRSFGGDKQTENQVKMSEALCKVAEEHGLESPTTIALAYVMSKTTNVFPIIGGRKVEHLQENIKALSIRLTPKQIEYLEGVIPFDVGFPMNFLLDDPTVTGKAGHLMGSTGPTEFVKAPRPIGYEETFVHTGSTALNL